MRRVTILLIFAAAIVISVVVVMATMDGPPTFGQGNQLAGSAWQLTSIDGRPALSAGEPIRLDFQDGGQIGGFAGCNSYGGSFSASGSSLTLSDVYSTMRACADDALNAQESAYLQAIGAVRSFEQAGDQLTLKDGAGVALLVFARR